MRTPLTTPLLSFDLQERLLSDRAQRFLSMGVKPVSTWRRLEAIRRRHAMKATRPPLDRINTQLRNQIAEAQP